jgi:GDP-L-fucose synthase
VGAKSKCLEVEKLQKVLPDLTLTNLHTGLAKTIAWFWEEQEKLVPA